MKEMLVNSKHILIALALLGVAFWSYPSTFALFTNDHAFYNGSAPCTKCHADIQSQLDDTGRVTALHRNLDTDYGCRACHADANNALGRNATQDYHSAYNPQCIECHANVSSINGVQESHTILVTGAATSTLTVGINEACIMCHTTLFESVTVRNRQVFAFENDSVAVNGTSVYDGSYTTTFVDSPPTGKHNFISDVQCIACHMPVYEVMNQSKKPYDKHMKFGCTGCHRGSGDKPKRTNEPQVTYHAAKIKYCSDCHKRIDFPRDCNQCHESHGGFKPGVD